VDYETLVELEIFGCEDSYSLFSLLSNTCVSAPGRKLLKSWFQTPLTDGLILQDRLDSVEGLMHQEETMSNMRGLLKKVGDPVKLLENVVKMQTIKPQVKHFVKLQEGFEALLLLQAASVQLVTRGWQKDADENRKPPKILVRLVHSISDELIYGTLIIRNEAGNTTDTII
jgi:DNA mismatch repair ATPase MutS